MILIDSQRSHIANPAPIQVAASSMVDRMSTPPILAWGKDKNTHPKTEASVQSGRWEKRTMAAVVLKDE